MYMGSAGSLPSDPVGSGEDHSSAGGSRTSDGDGGGGRISPAPPSRYQAQKRRDWTTFLQYLKNHTPPLTLPRCSGAHVIEFLKYLDGFGKTKVHVTGCPHFGDRNPPAPCACPLKQAWGSLDALIGRLRAAYEEIGGGRPESNPFAARAVGIYLREVKGDQAKARGFPHRKVYKKRKMSTIAAGEGGGADGSGGATVGPPGAASSTV
ncbi:unnamed protein product [Cuscuta campestris]|uniref:ALOG domain-containing protein n=1 Tax=Cuscuta campestris TaxID=132261 RepID=A0A484NHT2_9ASTE|nr:unnamed protein product [Cuscuta campestris]